MRLDGQGRKSEAIRLGESNVAAIAASGDGAVAKFDCGK
jgi:hypothetical protein